MATKRSSAIEIGRVFTVLFSKRRQRCIAEGLFRPRCDDSSLGKQYAGTMSHRFTHSRIAFE